MEFDGKQEFMKFQPPSSGRATIRWAPRIWSKLWEMKLEATTQSDGNFFYETFRLFLSPPKMRFSSIEQMIINKSLRLKSSWTSSCRSGSEKAIRKILIFRLSHLFCPGPIIAKSQENCQSILSNLHSSIALHHRQPSLQQGSDKLQIKSHQWKKVANFHNKFLIDFPFSRFLLLFRLLSSVVVVAYRWLKDRINHHDIFMRLDEWCASTVRERKSAISDDGLSRVCCCFTLDANLFIYYTSLWLIISLGFFLLYFYFSWRGWLCSLSGVYVCAKDVMWK